MIKVVFSDVKQPRRYAASEGEIVFKLDETVDVDSFIAEKIKNETEWWATKYFNPEKLSEWNGEKGTFVKFWARESYAD